MADNKPKNEEKKGKRLHIGDLVADIAAQNPEMSKGQIRKVLSDLFDYVPKRVFEGDVISVRRFGVFGVRHSGARKAINPKDPKQRVDVPAKDIFKFWPNWKLKSNLNWKKYQEDLASGKVKEEEDEEEAETS